MINLFHNELNVFTSLDVITNKKGSLKLCKIG